MGQEPEILTGAGAAYVLVEHAGVWAHEARVQASNPDAQDMFGDSVAIAGDLLAVGAPNEDSSAQGINGNQASNDSGNSGAAYLFERGAQGFSQTTYIKPGDPMGGIWFGWKLALRGTTLVAGIEGPQRDGSAYVFGIMNHHWSQISNLVAMWARPDAPEDFIPDGFGNAVALSPRGVIVGAPNERPFAGENGIGTVYCFE